MSKFEFQILVCGFGQFEYWSSNLITLILEDKSLKFSSVSVFKMHAMQMHKLDIYPS
jgi:hypothetical protein